MVTTCRIVSVVVFVIRFSLINQVVFGSISLFCNDQLNAHARWSFMGSDTIHDLMLSLTLLSSVMFLVSVTTMVLTNVAVTPHTAIVPFVFLFTSLLTLVVTGNLKHNPHLVEPMVREWIIVLSLVVSFSAAMYLVT
ncbi:MAG: hypothetical protein QXQ81_06080 [Candidatus Thorarchaeota archaeon]